MRQLGNLATACLPHCGISWPISSSRTPLFLDVVQEVFTTLVSLPTIATTACAIGSFHPDPEQVPGQGPSFAITFDFSGHAASNVPLARRSNRAGRLQTYVFARVLPTMRVFFQPSTWQASYSGANGFLPGVGAGSLSVGGPNVRLVPSADRSRQRQTLLADAAAQTMI